MLIDIIAGARPNFMKIAPIIEAIQTAKKDGAVIDFRLIHTGQHYDKNMSRTNCRNNDWLRKSFVRKTK
jgi:UDP-N-acetylglucosamine 2-epimerase (non-hydrolysing)